MITLSSQSTLLSAVVAAGGPGPTGSMRKILLRRDGKLISELDVYEFLVQGDKSKDVQLAAGDVIVFQPAGPRVAITGSIDTPAIFELKTAEEPLRDVLRYAGGAPVLANPNRVQLERIDPSQTLAKRFVETFPLDGAGLQKSLRDGDVLTLLAISPQFANAVTLKGHVAQPLRYPFTPGHADPRPDPRPRRTDLARLLPPQEPAGPGARRRRAAARPLRQRPRCRDQRQRAHRCRPDRAGTQRARFDPRQWHPRCSHPGDRLPGDRATENLRDDRLSSSGRATANERSDDVRSARTEDRLAVARSRRTPAALFEELNWDYATIERLTPDLSTQVISFNLGKAILQGDEANNIALAPGDVVTVYSQKDVRVPVSRQTRLVGLEGEVNAPGVYQLQPGETLQGPDHARRRLHAAGVCLRPRFQPRGDASRASARTWSPRSPGSKPCRRCRRRAMPPIGATTDARRSPRSAPRRRRRSWRGWRGSSRTAGSPSSSAPRRERSTPCPTCRSSTATASACRRGRASSPSPAPSSTTTPSSGSPDALPATTCASPVADEAADTSNMFILRADGTVNSASDQRGFFGRGGLESQVMQPGDALIVPNQLDFETWGRAFVRNLKDFAQIVSGFGIGIAAIHSLNN